MKAKIAVIALSAIFFIGMVNASGFGTFTSEKDVMVSGETASFSITVMNTGSRPLSVNFKTRGLDDAVVRFENDEGEYEDDQYLINLNSSSPTTNPSSEGSWYYLGNGKYVETRTVEFKVFLRGSDYEEFKVDVRAQAVGSGSANANATQNIVQVRSYSYSVTSEGGSSNPGEEGGQEDDPDIGFDFGGDDGGFTGLPGIGLGDGSSDSGSVEGGDDPNVTIEDGDEEDDEGDDSGTEGEGFNSSEDEGSEGSRGSITGGFFQNQNINGVTVILMLGVIASAVYLYKVI